jgi:hypothetical protein
MDQSIAPRRERADTVPWQSRPYLRMDITIEVTGLSRSTIYRLASAGRLTLRRLAGRVVVETAGVLTLVETAEPWRPGTRGAAARAKRSEMVRSVRR